MSAASVLDGLERGGPRDGARRDRPRRRLARGRRRRSRSRSLPAAALLGADVVFPVLHGPFGEDGTVQGLLESADVPYVGAGVLGSAVCMDKGVFKGLMAHAGHAAGALRGGHRARVEHAAATRRWTALRGLGLPVFVKPSRLGSSVGISKVSAADELARRGRGRARARSRRARRGGRRRHRGGVRGDRQRRAGGVRAGPGDRRRATGTTTSRSTPRAAWSWSCRPRSQPRSASGCAGSRRRRSCAPRAAAWRASTSSSPSEGQVLLNELNTIPGFTPTSVFARLFEASGVAYEELLDRLLALRGRAARARTRAHVLSPSWRRRS